MGLDQPSRSRCGTDAHSHDPGSSLSERPRVAWAKPPDNVGVTRLGLGSATSPRACRAEDCWKNRGLRRGRGCVPRKKTGTLRGAMMVTTTTIMTMGLDLRAGAWRRIRRQAMWNICFTGCVSPLRGWTSRSRSPRAKSGRERRDALHVARRQPTAGLSPVVFDLGEPADREFGDVGKAAASVDHQIADRAARGGR